MATVLQFGEGNFIRSFIDYLIQLRQDKYGDGESVVLVTPIDNPYWENFRKQDCNYHTCVCGKVDGKAVREYTYVTVVKDCVNPYREYDRYVEAYMDPELKVIISNTTEAGIAFNAADKYEDLGTFPAKITKILYERYKKYGEAGRVELLPLELIEKNGETLKAYVLKYAKMWGLGADFIEFAEKIAVYNSLVDKIVPGFPRGHEAEHFERIGGEDKLLTVGEAFLSLVIEGDDALKEKLPFLKDPRVKFTDDVRPYRERKVKILNGLHTALAPISMLAGVGIVRDAVLDPDLSVYAEALANEEIIPTIKMDKALLNQFKSDVLERFSNPYIDHLFSSIILNSVAKWKTRLLPSFLACDKGNRKYMLYALAALFCLYDSADFTINDGDDVKAFFAKELPTEQKYEAFIRNESFWGMDLEATEGVYTASVDYVRAIKAGKVRETLKAL
ncbi:MAG: tagaturonate reductase [Clostridia bacterium]|nr:tagaturonate reductase [Clostridia bacterium]